MFFFVVEEKWLKSYIKYNKSNIFFHNIPETRIMIMILFDCEAKFLNNSLNLLM